MFQDKTQQTKNNRLPWMWFNKIKSKRAHLTVKTVKMFISFLECRCSSTNLAFWNVTNRIHMVINFVEPNITGKNGNYNHQIWLEKKKRRKEKVKQNKFHKNNALMCCYSLVLSGWARASDEHSSTYPNHHLSFEYIKITLHSKKTTNIFTTARNWLLKK